MRQPPLVDHELERATRFQHVSYRDFQGNGRSAGVVTGQFAHASRLGGPYFRDGRSPGFGQRDKVAAGIGCWQGEAGS